MSDSEIRSVPFFFGPPKRTSKGLAKKIEEYVPDKKPIRRTRAKSLIVAPPNRSKQVTMNKVVNTVFMDLVKV